MTPGLMALLLFAGGVALIIGEALLPTHGVVGAFGVLAIVGGIVATFFVNQWLGLGVLVGLAGLSPLLLSWALDLYPRTPIGKRMVLQHAELPLSSSRIEVGQVGQAISELRPMGECEFENIRAEAISEHGIIPAGSKVKVVGQRGSQPVVRLLNSVADKVA